MQAGATEPLSLLSVYALEAAAPLLAVPPYIHAVHHCALPTPNTQAAAACVGRFAPDETRLATVEFLPNIGYIKDDRGELKSIGELLHALRRRGAATCTPRNARPRSVCRRPKAYHRSRLDAAPTHLFTHQYLYSTTHQCHHPPPPHFISSCAVSCAQTWSTSSRGLPRGRSNEPLPAQ